MKLKTKLQLLGLILMGFLAGMIFTIQVSAEVCYNETTCSEGYICLELIDSNLTHYFDCVPLPSCLDTCESLNKECGNWIICDKCVNCGECEGSCNVTETCPTLSCPSQSCGSSGNSKTIYKNNTITEYKYLTSNYKEPCEVVSCNETIKEVQIDKLIEISKPFYKSVWFYISIIFLIILIIGIFWER